MKLTESRLRQIINQEARRMMSETKYGMHNMPGPGDFDPEESKSQDGDTNYLRCTMQDGFVVVDEAGPSRSDAIAVQKMLNDYPDSAEDLMDLLNDIGIERVKCDGKTMFIDDFIKSL